MYPPLLFVTGAGGRIGTEERKRMAEEKKLVKIDVGMRLEVLTEEKKMLFRGKVKAFDGVSSIRLVDATGDFLPIMMFGTPLILRGFQGGKAVAFCGTIGGTTEDVWKVDELKYLYSEEKREYFRQDIEIGGMVQRTKRADPDCAPYGDEKVDCKLIDVSGGGVRIACSKAVYFRGDQLTVSNVSFLPGSKPFSFVCIVRRVVDDGFQKLYGCEFKEMNENEHDRLIQAIFQLQRMDSKNRY